MIFDDDTCRNIIKIHMPMRSKPDEVAWFLNANGKHMAMSFYLAEQTDGFHKGNEKIWKKLWDLLKIHGRLKLRLWRIASGSLLWVNTENAPCLSATPDLIMLHTFSIISEFVERKKEVLYSNEEPNVLIFLDSVRSSFEEYIISSSLDQWTPLWNQIRISFSTTAPEASHYQMTTGFKTDFSAEEDDIC